MDPEKANQYGIRPFEDNPFYWQYRGKPILLLGGTDQDNLFQWADDHDRLMEHLDTLEVCGGNYIRNTMSSRYYPKHLHGEGPGYAWDRYPYPFRKLDNGKYDLDQWNEAYWAKLDTLLRETHKRKIIVQLEIWDAWNLDLRAGWPMQPWNPDNNINYTYENTCCQRQFDFIRNPFFEATPAMKNDEILLHYQNRYIGRIVDACLAYDHVIFQIDNESPLPFEVSDYWAQFIRDRAAAGGRTAYVCDSRRFHRPSNLYDQFYDEFKDWSNPEISHPISNPDIYTFCDLSQNGGNWGQYHYDNIVWYRTMVKQHGIRPINHTKIYRFNWRTGATKFAEGPNGTDEEAGAKFWRTIFAGAASARFHRQYPGGLALTLLAQAHIRSMRMLTDAMNVFVMTPHNDLLSSREENEAYALAQPGRCYAVYFTGEGDQSVELDLSAAKGSLTLRWLDVVKSEWQDEVSVQGGGRQQLKSSGDGQWAALITSET